MNEGTAPFYRSSIPERAEERVVSCYLDRIMEMADYYVDGECVGRRQFFATGELEWEVGLKSGQRHGWEYRWDEPGKLLSAEPYEEGLAHGTASQWASDGTLIGTYTMEHGTGIDLWWEEWSSGDVTLAEVRYYRLGERHGFEWWLREDEASVWCEGHYHEGEPHGILREWNARGGLRRGFPQYCVHGRRVTKRQYLRAAENDPPLPPFRAEENKPRRTFPPEVARHVRRTGRS